MFPTRTNSKNGKQSKALPDAILIALTILYHVLGLSNEDMEILTRAAKDKSGNPLDDRGNFKQVGIMTMPKTIDAAYDPRKPKLALQQILHRLGYAHNGQMDLDTLRDNCMAELIRYIGHNPLEVPGDGSSDDEGEPAGAAVPAPDGSPGDGNAAALLPTEDQPKRGRGK